MPPHIEIVVPLDMGFYNITLSQIVVLHPLLAPLAFGIATVHDPELVSPYDVTVARESDARVTTAYASRSVGIKDVSYPTTSPTERVAAILRLRAFGFGTDGATAGGEVPEADNVNHRVVLYGDVGARRDFRIWTPPVFPATEMD